jgi:hypothetical protein
MEIGLFKTANKIVQKAAWNAGAHGFGYHKPPAEAKKPLEAKPVPPAGQTRD